MSWVSTQTRGAVRVMTLDNPGRKNAIPRDGWSELGAALAEFEASDDRALIVTGAGGDFCAGADLDPDMVSDEGSVVDRRARMKEIGAVALRLHRLTKPTIAAVDGAAVGAGLNLALGCDVVIATEGARFAEIFVRRGLTLDFGGSWLLPRIVGLQRAKEMALSGRIIGAGEALALGLCIELTPAAGLLDRALEIDESFVAQAPLAQMFAKQGIDHAWDHSFADALDLEGQSQAILFTTDDVTEGVNAFLEKRPPRFRGR